MLIVESFEGGKCFELSLKLLFCEGTHDEIGTHRQPLAVSDLPHAQLSREVLVCSLVPHAPPHVNHLVI